MGTGRWNVAMVTGASSGIGDAFARLLANEGTDLVLVARDLERLDRLAAELRAASGVTVEVMSADLGAAVPRAAVERRLSDLKQPIDLLINNAGFGTTGPFAELPVDREEQEVQVNIVALMRLSSAVLPGMVQRGRGAILNVASIAGLYPTPGTATYGATKAFVASHTDALHEELKGTGVTATSVLPGFTRTEFQERADWRAQSYVPDAVWMTAEQVAQSALNGAASGKARVIPGVTYKALNGLTAPMPAGLRRRLLGLSRNLGL